MRGSYMLINRVDVQHAVERIGTFHGRTERGERGSC